ncbi:MAG TPA: Uma2 family endonuclease [Polyangiaceae bacterium]|nr:Uma2 family endonuclease [Polyangiaceae bacterium]
MNTPARRATYEDLVAVPANKVAEILNGQLVVSPRPAAPHTLSSSVLGTLLGGPFHLGNRGGPGGWIILDEPELHFADDVLVPDLAGWLRTRMPEVPDVAAFTLAPDWVCEVLSRSTASHDRADKLFIYAREKVAHVWLVDPIARTLEVLRLDGSTYRLAATWRDEALVRAEPFDAIEIALATMWR